MTTNNSLQKKSNNDPKTLGQYLGQNNVKNQINNMLGGEKEAQKFISSISSATSTNLALQECDFSTVVSSALLATALNLSLSPTLGLAYIVPFNDKKNNRKVATFILGYKGYIQLAIRSGYYKKINVLAIKEGELKHYDPLTESLEVELIEDDEIRENLNTVGYYAMFEHLNGFKKAIYWTKKKMLIHANKYSKAFDLNATQGKYPKQSYQDFADGKVSSKDLWQYSSFWYSDFDGMAFKTMLRQLISKWGIMSIDFQKAFENDNEGMNNSENISVNESLFVTDNKPIQDTETATATEDVTNSFFNQP